MNAEAAGPLRESCESYAAGTPDESPQDEPRVE
jgi:hypothetical protein